MMDDARMQDIYRRVARSLCAAVEPDRFGLPAEVRPLAAAMLDELRDKAPRTIVGNVEVRGAHLWVRAVLPGTLRERAIAEQILDDYQSVPARLAMEIAEEWRDRG